MHNEVKALGVDGVIAPIYDQRWRLVWADKGSKEIKAAIPFEHTDDFCKSMKVSKLKPPAKIPILPIHESIIEDAIGPGVRLVFDKYIYWIDCTGDNNPKFVFRIYDQDYPDGCMDFDIKKTDLSVIIDDDFSALYIASGEDTKDINYIGETSKELARKRELKSAYKKFTDKNK